MVLSRAKIKESYSLPHSEQIVVAFGTEIFGECDLGGWHVSHLRQVVIRKVRKQNIHESGN